MSSFYRSCLSIITMAFCCHYDTAAQANIPIEKDLWNDSDTSIASPYSLRQQPDPRCQQPVSISVTTLERVAAAKTGIELQYQNLIREPTARKLRRQLFEQDIAQQGLSFPKRKEAHQAWLQAETDHLRQVRALKNTSLTRSAEKEVVIPGYEVVRVLGRGSFGTVRLIAETPEPCGIDGVDWQHIAGGAPRVYAMKVIRKPEMLRNCQEGHIRAERDFLVQNESSRSPWIVSLYGAFQDNSNLYLFMEFMVGGDFLGVLLREEVLDEDIARWYTAEMVLGIEAVHKQFWIHRDVKPDNFLISSSGHLKISDFGLAFDGNASHSQSYYADKRQTLLQKFDIKISGDLHDVSDLDTPMPDVEDSRPCATESLLSALQTRRSHAKSIVGTSQYMAPEIILGDPYDGRCD